MTAITEGAVLDALRAVQEPELGRDIVTLDMVKSIVIDGDAVAFTIELTTPACPLKDEIEGNTRSVLAGIGVSDVQITWGAMVRRAAPRQAEQLVPGVKNIIAVASGKGGVGKSTVSVNLAVALAQAGATVGLLDGDITGPNIPLMMGIEGQPKASANNKITPLERYGVKTISIQFFVPEGQPIVWRGPARRRGDPAVPARRRLGRARLPRHRPAARHVRRAADAGPGRPDQRRGPRHDAPGGLARATSRRRSRCSSG